ncbi:hypothetical protein BDZ89DRAFT_1137523 [Hymenopellis radicata]|nr:hypothetical protein BDZ89DRAFT_1137523 [Hymenopellis radicata]
MSGIEPLDFVLDQSLPCRAITLPTPEPPRSLPLPKGFRKEIASRRGYRLSEFRSVQVRLKTYYSNLSHLRRLKDWVFLILGLPEGLRGVDVDFCLGLFTTVYVLRLLDAEARPMDVYHALEIYVTRAILAHDDAVKAHVHTQLNGFPSPDDIDYGGPSSYYCRYTVYRHELIDRSNNDGVAMVDLPGYKEMPLIPDRLPRTSAPVPPSSDAFVPFLSNSEAPLVVQFEEFARVITSVLQGISTARWQSRSQAFTLDDLERSLGAVSKGRESFLVPEESSYRATERGILGEVLQVMKHVNIKNYTAVEMTDALRDSYLYDVMRQVASSAYLTKLNGDHSQALVRFGATQTTFLQLLYNWAPTECESWLEQDLLFTPKVEPGPAGYLLCTKKGAGLLLNILLQQPNLMPRLALPGVVYFLLSQENYILAWRWLGPALEETDWGVHEIGSSVNIIKQFFTILKSVFSEKTDRGGLKHWKCQADEGNPVAAVFARTAELHIWDLEQTWYLQANRPNKTHMEKLQKEAQERQIRPFPQPLACRHCLFLPPEEQCSRVFFTSRKDKSKVQYLQTHGISFDKERIAHPPDGAQIYHPDALGLQELDASEDVLQRCGRMIWIISDADGMDDIRPAPASS